MGIQLRQSASGEFLRGTVSGQVPVWNQEADEWDVSSGIFTRSDPVYVEDYLPETDNDIRNAIVAALADKPNSHVFILPSGSWNFVGRITQNDGFRNGLTFVGQQTQLYRDVNGVAGSQEIFFFRSDTGSTHADRITFMGIRFTLLNALTSFFGFAVGLENASNCRLYDCEFDCTLAVGATQGRIRWGAAILGGPNAGNNIVDNCKVTISQLVLCGIGRNIDGVLCTNLLSVSNNDYAVSCVTGPGFSLRNVTIDGVELHDAAGSGCIFVGSDGVGSSLGGTVVSNICVQNVNLSGSKNPVLDFDIAGIIVIDLGLTSENVCVQGINTTLSSTELQAMSVLIAAQDDEVSSMGISVTNCNLGIITTNDPLEGLFIQGNLTTNVQVSNVHVRGLRGIRIMNCDRLSVVNCTTIDGFLRIEASTRNLSSITVVGCNLRRVSGFNAALSFSSTNGRSMLNVCVGDLVLDSNVAGIATSLAGGTMTMSACNLVNTSGSNPTAETLTGIVRAVNIRGFAVITTVSVTVPAVAAGSVDYVNVSMTGTRLADLTTAESVVANPQTDLVAAGAGGGFINARVSATGTVRCAFIGPLAGGAANFSFARAA